MSSTVVPVHLLSNILTHFTSHGKVFIPTSSGKDVVVGIEWKLAQSVQLNQLKSYYKKITKDCKIKIALEVFTLAFGIN